MDLEEEPISMEKRTLTSLKGKKSEQRDEMRRGQ
jgi:hypothetical protein